MHPAGPASSFGDESAAYDRFRPGYPDRLYEDLFTSGRRDLSILEIGAGTGKATVALSARSVVIVALEPDPRMAELLEGHSLPNVDTVVASIEAWDPPEAMFDIAVSAQAWHWVDPVVGLANVASAVKPGGGFATWWTTPSHDK